MDLQPCRCGIALAVALLAGCEAAKPTRVRYTLEAAGPPGSTVRMYRSAHHQVYTTVPELPRVEAAIATLEASYAACVELTGFRPAGDVAPQSVFLFEQRVEWEAFTRRRAGPAADLYLKLDRGGYTLGKACVVRDQGDRDTLTVLSHEEFHLFIANHFVARPPPFLEEGLATLLETVEAGDGVAKIDLGRSASRGPKIVAIAGAGELVSLRTLLSMHAGNVVGLSPTEIDAFYAQAWAFARFLREGEGGRYRPMLMKLLSDAASGALSSESLPDNPALVERYLGQSLDSLEPAYKKFARRLVD